MRWTKGGLVWAVILGLLPFCPFLDQRVDLWHAQGHWLELGILLAWFISLSSARMVSLPKPIMLWGISLSVSGMLFWHSVVAKTHQYPLVILPPMMHWLLILIGLSAILTLQQEDIDTVLKWIAISGSVMVAYGCLQWLGFDQFFKDMNPAVKVQRNIVGTIGNVSHFSAYLAMLLPIFLTRKERNLRWMAIPAIFLILIGKSAAAQAAALAGLAWLWRRDFRKMAGVFGIALIGLFIMHSSPESFNPHGRWSAWQTFFQMFQQKPITGNGLGFIYEISKVIKPESPIYTWRHAHCEPLQILVEQGILGLFFCIWTLASFGRRIWQAKHTPILSACCASFLAFLTNSLLNFPGHLAMIGGIALFCFGSAIVLVEREAA